MKVFDIGVADKLSAIYNNTNAEKIASGLSKVKLYFGTVVFERMLDDILNGNIGGVSRTINLYKEKVPEFGTVYTDVMRNIEDRNAALESVRHGLLYANMHNTPEAKCDNCGAVRSDVSMRSNKQRLCEGCAKDIIDTTRIDPMVISACRKGYDIGSDDTFDFDNIFNFDNTDDDIIDINTWG